MTFPTMGGIHVSTRFFNSEDKGKHLSSNISIDSGNSVLNASMVDWVTRGVISTLFLMQSNMLEAWEVHGGAQVSVC